MRRRVGILTGGGDAPGLNAVIRAFVKCGVVQLGWEVWGVHNSFNGLLSSPRGLQLLDPVSCQGLLHRGGTILGTTNRGDPFRFPNGNGGHADRAGELARAVTDQGLEGLVVIGGDGTMRIAARLMEEHGIPIVGVPKTIDNDLSATDVTFGFQSAVDVATEALDRLHTTASSHERVMFLEVMGRDTGHIALRSGLAGGADMILIPEIPYDAARLAKKILRRQELGRDFATVVVAEGAAPASSDARLIDERRSELAAAGGAAVIAMGELQQHVDAEMRVCVLGHIQRGGSPSPFDRVLATRFGIGAVDLVAEDRWGEMVRISNDRVDGAPLGDAAETRRVDVEGELVRTARAVGIEFGG